MRSSTLFFTSTVAGDDARLLQREAGLKDGVALRRPYSVKRQFGPLVELSVHDRVRQSGRGDEDAPHIVRVSQSISASLLVDRKHPSRQVGIFLEESPRSTLRMPQLLASSLR